MQHLPVNLIWGIFLALMSSIIVNRTRYNAESILCQLLLPPQRRIFHKKHVLLANNVNLKKLEKNGMDAYKVSIS